MLSHPSSKISILSSTKWISILKLRCNSRFQRAFTVCNCIFKVITLVGSNQGNYFENTTACSKRLSQRSFSRIKVPNQEHRSNITLKKLILS